MLDDKPTLRELSNVIRGLAIDAVETAGHGWNAPSELVRRYV